MHKTTKAVIEHYGGIKGVQKRFKYQSPMAVYNWGSRGIPVRLIADIHLDTDIPIRSLKRASQPRK